MFAIAWKEYRRIRWVVLSLCGLLVGGYFLLLATPWVEGRVSLIAIGALFVAALVGALAFSEERRARTEVFVETLPVGAFSRWAVGIAANLLLAAGTICLLVLVIYVAEALRLGGLPESLPVRFVEAHYLLLVLLAVWSLAVFASSVFENAVLALVFALMTGTAALNAGIIGYVWLCRVFQPTLLTDSHAGRLVPAISSLSILVVCLAFSCVFETLGMKRLRIHWRLIAAFGVIVLAVVTAALILFVFLASGLVRS